MNTFMRVCTCGSCCSDEDCARRKMYHLFAAFSLQSHQPSQETQSAWHALAGDLSQIDSELAEENMVYERLSVIAADYERILQRKSRCVTGQLSSSEPPIHHHHQQQ